MSDRQDFDDFLDEVADAMRHETFESMVGTMAPWYDLTDAYRATLRARAMDRAARVLMERSVAHYDDDMRRPPSFTTIAMMREYLRRTAGGG